MMDKLKKTRPAEFRKLDVFVLGPTLLDRRFFTTFAFKDWEIISGNRNLQDAQEEEKNEFCPCDEHSIHCCNLRAQQAHRR
jgi:hypothetical protein